MVLTYVVVRLSRMRAFLRALLRAWLYKSQPDVQGHIESEELVWAYGKCSC